MQAAKNLRDGIEPTQPWHPEAYRYHTANVTIEGTLDEAIRQAKSMAASSYRDAQKVAPQISV
jgi:hypothetical protein